MLKDVFIPKNRRLPVLSFYKLEKPKNEALSFTVSPTSLPYLTDKDGKAIKVNYHKTDLQNLYYDFNKFPQKNTHQISYMTKYRLNYWKPTHISHMNVHEVSFDLEIKTKANVNFSAYEILQRSGHLKKITAALKKNPKLEFELIVGDFRHKGRQWEYKEYKYNEKKTKDGVVFVRDTSNVKSSVISSSMIFIDSHHHHGAQQCCPTKSLFNTKPTPPTNYPIRNLNDAKTCVFKGKALSSSELGFVSYKLGGTRHVIGFNMLNVGS